MKRFLLVSLLIGLFLFPSLSFSQPTTSAMRFRINDSLLIKDNGYINFGSQYGLSGYGFRNLNGTLQSKNLGGSWGTLTADLTAPGPIGGTTPNAGTFTALKATESISAPVIADTTLSGTPVIITIIDQATGTPYYFKAYPTKP